MKSTEKFYTTLESAKLQKIIADNEQELLAIFAEDFHRLAKSCLQVKSKFEVLLTGGTLGISVLRNLSRLSLPWSRVSFQFGDERFVPLEDPDRNELQAITAWPELAYLNLHRYPDTNQSLENARQRLDAEFTLRFGEVTDSNPVFDLAIVGFGPDGHVASLFPGRETGDNWIVSESNSPKPPTERLSLSYRALNRASNLWFLAAGKQKAEVVRCALGGECQLPLAKVAGQDSTLWYLDRELSDEL
ncbi:MAG: 6-phosphogluconolactonase [Actinomycetota bacterium]